MSKSRFLDYVDGFLHLGLGWLKAQLIFFLLNLVVISVALTLFGVKLAFLIALGISLLEFIPVLGSGIVFVPWAIIAACSGNTSMAIKIGLLYVGLVVVRQILDPIISGKAMGIRPLVALGAAILGILLLGLPGLILGPIIAAIVNVIYKVRAQHINQDQRAQNQQDKAGAKTKQNP